MRWGYRLRSWGIVLRSTTCLMRFEVDPFSSLSVGIIPCQVSQIVHDWHNDCNTTMSILKDKGNITWRYRSRDARLLACWSLASDELFSSYRLQLYHWLPCSLQGPIQIQQNSYPHFRQVIWLHPPFFSMVEAHLEHSLVFALIQFAVSESSLHFLSHFLTSGQRQGWWSWRVQPKQKAWPQQHRTVGTIWSNAEGGTWHSTAYSQLGAGHHLR